MSHPWHLPKKALAHFYQMRKLINQHVLMMWCNARKAAASGSAQEALQAICAAVSDEPSSILPSHAEEQQGQKKKEAKSKGAGGSFQGVTMQQSLLDRPTALCKSACEPVGGSKAAHQRSLRQSCRQEECKLEKILEALKTQKQVSQMTVVKATSLTRGGDLKGALALFWSAIEPHPLKSSHPKSFQVAASSCTFLAHARSIQKNPTGTTCNHQAPWSTLHEPVPCSLEEASSLARLACASSFERINWVRQAQALHEGAHVAQMRLAPWALEAALLSAKLGTMACGQRGFSAALLLCCSVLAAIESALPEPARGLAGLCVRVGAALQRGGDVEGAIRALQPSLKLRESAAPAAASEGDTSLHCASETTLVGLSK